MKSNLTMWCHKQVLERAKGRAKFGKWRNGGKPVSPEVLKKIKNTTNIPPAARQEPVVMRLILTICSLQPSLRSCAIKKNNRNIFGIINIFTLLKLQNGELIKKKSQSPPIWRYKQICGPLSAKNWLLVHKSHSFTTKTFFVMCSLLIKY